MIQIYKELVAARFLQYSPQDWHVAAAEETESGRVELAILSGPRTPIVTGTMPSGRRMNVAINPEWIMPEKKSNKKQMKQSVTRGKTEHTGSPANDQDVKRRLGNFVGAGEHARKGGRTTGIVGQKTSKSRTDQ